MASILDYFLGAISPSGYAGFFDTLCDNNAPFRTFIIKAGPGCGKSSMMRRIADRATAAGHDLQLIHCASDPLSLDCVICPALDFAIVDGTAPHVLEPKIPGAVQQVVSLYHTLDNKLLAENRADIIRLYELNAAHAARARRFIMAAGSLYTDIERTAVGLLLHEKVARYARNLAARLLPKGDGTRGRETPRFTCAVTPAGIVDFAGGNYAGCDSVHIFEDRYGAAAHRALAVIREAALAAGQDIVTCRGFMAPSDTIEVVYLPALSTCFLHSSYISPLEISGAHVIRDRRFYDTAGLVNSQRRLNFCKKAVGELLNEAGALLGEAKSAHDDLEQYYINAVDFDAVHVAEQTFCQHVGLDT